MHIIIKFIIGLIVSLYMFPIGFTFLPPSFNTKIPLALLGGIVFFFDHIPIIKLKLNPIVMVSTIIASVFSLVCFFSADYNITQDYSYATYISSFFVWIMGAYFVGAVIRRYHGDLSFRILGYYIIAVCFTQCVLALMIDNIPSFKSLVDAYIFQGQEFLNRIDRLYGIGASLDPAGVRFSVALIIGAALLSKDNTVRSNRLHIILLLFGFFFIGMVGNMISRTTIIGLLMGLFYFGYASGLFGFIIKVESIKLGFTLAFVLLIVIASSVYLYQSNEEFYSNIRFAFEGFFNWVETGEWRTDSTDKLNNEMWIWPEDTKTWIIGSGIFGSWEYNTDIGYCRFILYCGLIGFSVFALLFVYNAIAFMRKVPKYWMLFLLFGILTFVIWVKVSTDIFYIYALMYCVDTFTDDELNLEKVS